MVSLGMRDRLTDKIVRWALGPAILFIGAGGCVDGVAVYSDISYAVDVQTQLEYATAGYQMKTRIQGNPFAVPEDRLITAVTTAMRGSNPGPPVTFSTDPATKTRRPYHVVVRFNPPVSMGGEELCKGAARSSDRPAPGKIHVAAAFCFGDQVLSEVQGNAANVAGLDDPRFRFLIQQVTQVLFPPDDLTAGDPSDILVK